MTRPGPLPLLLLLLGIGCAPGDSRERVVLVTTTTVEGSGLVDTLVAAYHASQDRYRLAPTAVGSGAALALGRRGDADLLLTHHPTAEAAFMEAGHGTEQGPLMRNEFVIAGPPEDPASIRGTTDLADAIARIASAGAAFVSRGDDSGTHSKERELRARGREASPIERWDGHIEAGSGMAETLRIADQRRAYVLTDRGTFRHLSGTLRLEILARGQPPEPNPYRYTVPALQSNPRGARDFLSWLLGPGREVIAAWGADRDGPLFMPVEARDADSSNHPDRPGESTARSDPTADTAATPVRSAGGR
jgi:tungstate transport system substrate-binding protein